MRKFLFSFSLVVGMAAVLIHRFNVPDEGERVQASKTLSVEPKTFKPSQASVIPQHGVKRATDTESAFKPPMLQGTEVHGRLQIDENGNLIVSQDVRHVFDYFLQLGGTEEYALGELAIMVEEYLSDKLDGDALSQAVELFDRYYEFYLEREQGGLAQSMVKPKKQFDGRYTPNKLESVRHYYEELADLKNMYFSDTEREALFTNEERYSSYMLKRMEIADSGFSEEEKAYMLEELERNTDNKFIEQREQTFALQAVKTQNLDNPTGWDKLAQRYGPEKARQLQALEAQRRAWREKKQQYRELREQLTLEHSYYSASEIDELLETYMLVDLNFSPSEVKRIKSLEGRM